MTQPPSSFTTSITGIGIKIGNQVFEFEKDEIEIGFVDNTEVIAHQVLVVLESDKKDTNGETLKEFVENLYIRRDIWFKHNDQLVTVEHNVIEVYTAPFSPAPIEVTNINVTFTSPKARLTLSLVLQGEVSQTLVPP